MSLSLFDSFQSQFETHLLNRPRIIKSAFVLTSNSFLSKNYYLFFPHNKTINRVFMEFYSIPLHILMPISAIIRGILVDRKIQWVKIYFQYLHTTEKGYTPL